jgi:hypothetical protein
VRMRGPSAGMRGLVVRMCGQLVRMRGRGRCCKGYGPAGHFASLEHSQ